MTAAAVPLGFAGIMKEIGHEPSEAVRPWKTVEARAEVERMRTWTTAPDSARGGEPVTALSRVCTGRPAWKSGFGESATATSSGTSSEVRYSSTIWSRLRSLSAGLGVAPGRRRRVVPVLRRRPLPRLLRLFGRRLARHRGRGRDGRLGAG